MPSIYRCQTVALCIPPAAKSTAVAGAAQDENEEMGRELAEGKLHAVERQAALAKAFAEQLRKAFTELEDAENEELQV